jgi:Domain of unknown function (DUF4249)
MRLAGFMIAVCTLFMCRKPFEPAVIMAISNFLVVDGVINADPNGPTVITLSRTRSLYDSLSKRPENGAFVVVESNDGQRYNLAERSSGVYEVHGLPIQSSKKYRLYISTNDGNRFESDFSPVLITPPIDSVQWQQTDDVSIFVNTHDPNNSTRYYRWEYDETYEYHSKYYSVWMVRNGQAFIRTPAEQDSTCWQTVQGPNIVTGTSAQLADDVIPRQLITVIPKGSEKINHRYSILVKQYALTPAAYNYWQILKKNSQELGSLFDAQPSQLVGNIHCITRPGDPVLGYVNTSSVTTKRIFIDSLELRDWQVADTNNVYCVAKTLDVGFPFYNYADTSYTLYFYSGSSAVALPKRCLECTWRGGTNIKPTFW